MTAAKGFDRPAHRQMREMSIQAALEWAFGVEHAALDFLETKGDNARPGVSPLWTLMQRGEVGCKIDGGGRSLPADDADILASAVANLPVSYGGRRMAMQVAELARAGSVPDWCRDDRVRCVPVGMRTTKRGEFALKEWAPSWAVERARAPKTDWYRMCPVTYTPTAREIAAKRRNYLDWWGALLWLQAEMRTMDLLTRIRVNGVMPPMTPWRPQAQGVDEAA